MRKLIYTLVVGLFINLSTLFGQSSEIKKTDKYLSKGQTEKVKSYIQKLRKKDHKSAIPDYLTCRLYYYSFQETNKESYLHKALGYYKKSHKKSDEIGAWDNQFYDSLYFHSRNTYENLHEEHEKKRNFYGHCLITFFNDSIHIYSDKPNGNSAIGSIKPAHVSQSEKELRESIINFAKQFEGTPYKWAGEKPEDGGFDCSGFVQYVFKNHEIILPHKASMIADSGAHVDPNKIQPGDIIAFGSRSSSGKHSVYHIGIVFQTEGELKVIHSVSRGVKIDPLGEGAYWAKNILFFRKLIE